MRLPAHIIGIGPIEGDRKALFSAIRFGDSRMLGATTHMGPFRTTSGLIASLEYVGRNYVSGPLSHVHVVDCEGLEGVDDVEFTTLLTGPVDVASIVEAATAALREVMTVDPEERAWLESHGFTTPNGVCWQRGTLSLLPIPALSVRGAYPRRWLSTGLTYTRQALNLPVQSYCGVLLDDPAMTAQMGNLEDFIVGIIPEEDATWLAANGFEFVGPILYTKEAQGITFRLEYDPAEREWCCEAEHPGASPDSVIDEDTSPAKTYASTAERAYRYVLDHCVVNLEAFTASLTKLRAVIDADFRGLAEFREAVIRVTSELPTSKS